MPLSSHTGDVIDLGGGRYAQPAVLLDSVGDIPQATAEGTAYPSAARTATPTAQADQTNPSYRGIAVVVDITAVTATPLVTITIQGKDPASGKYYTLLASAALGAVATTVLRVYPGLVAAANLAANDVLPRTWRIIATHGDADSATYSVGFALLP